MPTELVLQANYFSQRISNIFCPFHFLQWDAHSLQWRFQDIQFRKRWWYYILIAYHFVNIPICLIHFSQYFGGHSDAVISRNVLCGVLYALYGLINFQIVYQFIVYGKELLHAVNWIYRHEGFPYSPRLQWLVERRQRGMRDFFKVFYIVMTGFWDIRGDWSGLLIIISILILPIVAFLLALFLSIIGVDVVYILSSKLFDMTTNPFACFIIHLCRHVYLQIVIQWVYINGRGPILTTVAYCTSFIKILATLKIEPEPTPKYMQSLICLYRKLTLSFSVVSQANHSIIATVSGIGYLFIALGSCGAIITARQGQHLLASCIFLFTFILFCADLIMLMISGFVHSCSTSILVKWKDSCATWKNIKGTIMQREVKACRPLIVKAGQVTVITKQLNRSYLNALVTCENPASIISQTITPHK